MASFNFSFSCLCTVAVSRPPYHEGCPINCLYSRRFPVIIESNSKKSIRVRTFAAVESERLFVEIAKQMERLNTDIRSADGSL
jgi:hypothetical protein